MTEPVLYVVSKLGQGHTETACRALEGGDLIAVITHPPGGKWVVHPVHASRSKHQTMKAAQKMVEELARK